MPLLDLLEANSLISWMTTMTHFIHIINLLLIELDYTTINQSVSIFGDKRSER